MFKLLYVLGGAVLGAVIVESSPALKTAVNTANLKVSKLFENAKHRFADMEL